MAKAKDAIPIRDHMDDPKIKWRTEKPDYSKVDAKYLKERTKNHTAGSLEKIVENLVKTWEMESTHKVDTQDWATIKHDVYQFSTNGGPKHDVMYNIEHGNYNMMLESCPLFDVTNETNKSSHDLFKSCFPAGFAWEMLEVHSGPPTVTFTWRHWGHFEGAFGEKAPSNEMLEMYGAAVVRVTDALKIIEIQVYFDPNPVIGDLLGHVPSKCPFSVKKKIDADVRVQPLDLLPAVYNTLDPIHDL